ncbi:MAG TPA: hypothetical protein VFA41_12975 [Ktedonobacteraceae bacterium]|jgi:hypothetical protein|nr:hypothetical protein [Ktedonobacteraceae bacterium]
MLPLNKMNGNVLKRSVLIAGLLVLIASIIVVFFAYQIANASHRTATATPTAHPTMAPTLVPTPTNTPTTQPLTPTPTLMPTVNPASVLGIDSSPGRYFNGIYWIRLSYPSCGFGDLNGQHLKTTMRNYHNMGLHVLLTVCQPASSGSRLFDPTIFSDLAQSSADAIQCGNEQMKQNALTTYVAPADFARFYDMCERAVHAVQPNTPVLMGSLDPKVGGVDYGGLYYQEGYLNQMQYAMNTQVHPGGNWSWRSHAIGLIDSWHNGYPSQSVNSLYALFLFWAQQFGVSLDGGQLGQHLWVIEGTGCFKGCGIDPYSSYQVAVSHVLTLITDARTAVSYKVPFFYFNDRDFIQDGLYWPIGILDTTGHPKPIRQDLPMGARVLDMSCPGGQVRVQDQEQLLAKIYQGCALPGNYQAIIVS